MSLGGRTVVCSHGSNARTSHDTLAGVNASLCGCSSLSEKCMSSSDSQFVLLLVLGTVQQVAFIEMCKIEVFQSNSALQMFFFFF